MENVALTAKLAREISESVYKNADVDEILEAVRNAASKGEYKCYRPKVITKFQKAKLEGLGFKVRIDDNQRDPYTEISWE